MVQKIDVNDKLVQFMDHVKVAPYENIKWGL